MAACTRGKFAYPPEWSDKERMHYLLAPIPPNKTPTSSDPKITFWSNLVTSSCRELRRPVFTERELQARFKWNHATSPSCLSFVIGSMERAGEITKLSEIRQSEGVGWVSWGVGMIRKPVSWALKNYLSSTNINVDEEYVVLSTVKELAERVVAEQQKTVEYQSTDRVMKYGSFVELCKKVAGTEMANVSVVELWLMKEKRITKVKRGNQEIVKFCENMETVTDTDIEILSIKESIQALSSQVCQLQELSAQLKQKAIEQFKAKNKKAAVTLLRRQKATEASLNKREGALDNMQNILLQIQMAETDAMIYDAYKRGTEALTSLRESLGFVVDDIDEVAMNLQDALEANREISEALNQVSQEAYTEDSDDLEAELQALLETDQGEATPSVMLTPTAATKQTVSAAEDELEAKLASLTLGGGIGSAGASINPTQKASDHREYRTAEPSSLHRERDKVPKQSTKKQQALPA